MTNEEGGIDVEEFRYASLVDRVATTSATWLGLTIQCAQCHSHKYDPITQREYYQFLAFFNNADEPETFDVPDPVIAKKRAASQAEITAREADLENQFPVSDPNANWEPLAPISAISDSGATLSIRPDGAVVASGPSPDKATYTILAEVKSSDMDAIRIEAIGDPGSPAFGPGRTAHGNFVLTGFSALLEPLDASGKTRQLPFTTVTADVSQSGFDPQRTLDADPKTGWAIDNGAGRLDKTRSAVFQVDPGFRADGAGKLRLALEQQYGGGHTLGRFRISVRRRPKETAKDGDIARLRREHLASKMSAWETSLKPHRWSVLTPSEVVSRKNATMTVQPDGSVLVTGDKPNNDVYELRLPAPASKITAIRLETLPDPSLPENGPGRAPLFSVGDFILTELNLSVETPGDPLKSRALRLINASQDFAEPGHTASEAIDGVPESGWTIKGATGRPHAAVFELAEPLVLGEPGTRLALTLHQFGIHQTTIGKFRISVTGDATPVRATVVPAEVEAALLVPASKRTPDQANMVKQHFLSMASETSSARAKMESMRRSMPRFTTTLVMQERDPKHARTTNIHRRGEFLSLADAVSPGVPAVLPALESSGPKTRLELARWMVSGDHPLVARVAVNSMWQAFFGRGLVATAEDFGTRGEPPTHPELLDWLAVEFPAQGWSQKAMHRLIVTSSTYRQSSKATPELIGRDPKNTLFARGARFRVEAETVRDIALVASGLFNPKIAGPSVYPPQPDGVTNLAYGQMSWPTSAGADRYRRGLYAYSKRTAPYAAYSLMDAPSPDAACVRRERSNTPLQALTLLNDPVFVEASRALALRTLSEIKTSPEDRATLLVRLCLARNPSADELRMLMAFYRNELARFRSGSVKASDVAGADLKGFDRDEVAAWVLLARAVLNLDETITRE